jgi:TolA-binding protein
VSRPTAVLALAAMLASCAPSLGQPFMEARAAAERSYSAGRYDEAARHWQEAARVARRQRDRTEARYRRAVSLRRAGRTNEAKAELTALVHDRPKSERATRAAFDLADMEIESGDRAQGFELLEAAVRAHPGFGLSAESLARLVRFRQDQGGQVQALAYLDRMRRLFEKTELGEQALFQYARELDGADRDEQALSTYLEVARRYPYPEGALWDDALWYAAKVEERLGRPKQAVAHLERMLKEREPSSLQGSYERPRYAAARYHIAELYRDALGDHARARREFHRVWSEHTTSLLRDDALWNEARLAQQDGDQDEACSLLEQMVSKAADSRYAACVQALCPRITPAKGECHAYVVRALQPEPEPETP